MTRSPLESWPTPDYGDASSPGATPPQGTPLDADGEIPEANPTSSTDPSATAITLTPPPPDRSSPRGTSWRRRLRLGVGLLALGGVGYGLWAWLLRPPLRPYVLDLSPSASEYATTAQQTPLLNWEISHPRQVETLVIRTFTADGSLVGDPQTYDLSEALPVDLLAYCRQTPQRLTCQNVPTTLRQPGQYRFELTLRPKEVLNLPPEQATSSLVTLTDRPLPVAIELVPRQVIYSEAGTRVTANTPTLAPPVTGKGVELSWIVTHPEVLQDLLLVVRQPGGTSLGGRRFSLRNPENPTQVMLPEELKPFCRLESQLVCQGVPTGMTQVGQYQFELTPIPVGLRDTEEPMTKVSEVVAIQARPVAITAFRINGRDADPTYLVPVDPSRPIPGFQLDWEVEGGSTTKVELLPSPGTVGRSGRLRLPLAPTGTTTITLRVSDGQNPPLVRAVTFETFNPTPTPPIVVQPQGNQAGRPSAPRTPNPQAPTPPASSPAQPAPTRPSPPPPTPQNPPSPLPEDLRNRDLEDLNLQF